MSIKQSILSTIKDYIETYWRKPIITDIASRLNLSPDLIARQLKELETEGYIVRQNNVGRGYYVTSYEYKE